MRKKPTTRERIFMAQVKELPCVICGHSPVEVHHITERGRRLGNMFCLPLCVLDHRGDRGFSGKDRQQWDKSLSNQLFLLEKIYKVLGQEPPIYKTKVVRRYHEIP